MKTDEIFIGRDSIVDSFVRSYEFPFQALSNIKDEILRLGPTLGDDYEQYKPDVWIHKSVKLSEFVTIEGPAIIDSEAQIRPGAYIRGNVIIGKRCVFGNSCEIKNSILYDDVQVPHFNYVGDSILGNHSHMGAGAIISNLKNDKKNVVIRHLEDKIDTGLRKVGAFIGDNVDIGCNSVLNPGTIVAPRTKVYPLTMVRGYIRSDVIVKNMNDIVDRR